MQKITVLQDQNKHLTKEIVKQQDNMGNVTNKKIKSLKELNEELGMENSKLKKQVKNKKNVYDLDRKVQQYSNTIDKLKQQNELMAEQIRSFTPSPEPPHPKSDPIGQDCGPR